MLKLLFIVPRFGSIHRGAEVFVRELATQLDPTRFHITILSGPHDECPAGIECVTRALVVRERGERIYQSWLEKLLNATRIKSPTELESLTLMLRSIGLLRRNQFDIVVPLGGYWTYLFARVFCRKSKIVAIGQGGPVRKEIRLSDVFVALTPTDQERARVRWSKTPSVVIPNGVDTKRFTPGSADQKPTRPTVLCVAALVPSKRHDLLFDAVALLDQEVQLVCAGRGPLLASLEEHPLARQGRVTFLDLTPDQMPDYYRSAHVFSLASPNETFGIVFVEALASGLPVVASDGPRQRYILEDAGILCDVTDKHNYADALARALAAANQTVPRERALKFEWSKIARLYEELFSNLSLGHTMPEGT